MATTVELKNIIEAILMASDEPISLARLQQLINVQDDTETAEAHTYDKQDFLEAIAAIKEDYADRAFECIEVANGYRFRIKQDYSSWVAKLWELKPVRYSRAFLETLVLIAYKQPITRAEIEQVRGVAVSSHIIRSLLERDWIKVVGHRDVPGKPAVLATTKTFLDYFHLKNLEDLPSLQELQDLDKAGEQLELQLETAETTSDPEVSLEK